jgi:drug/metabolite transporter (DMT)-like permease
MRLFDLRFIIAFLFGVYGVVLVVVGLGFTTAEDLTKAQGININLWAGIAMVVLSAVFAGWAAVRPQFARTEPVAGSAPDLGPDSGPMTGDDLGKRG